jgi:hypothetical protein
MSGIEVRAFPRGAMILTLLWRGYLTSIPEIKVTGLSAETIRSARVPTLFLHKVEGGGWTGGSPRDAEETRASRH